MLPVAMQASPEPTVYGTSIVSLGPSSVRSLANPPDAGSWSVSRNGMHPTLRSYCRAMCAP